MEVSNEIKNVRLCPLFVAILTTATILNLPQVVRGENKTPELSNAEISPSQQGEISASESVPSAQTPKVAAEATSSPVAPISQEQPATPNPATNPPEPTPSPSSPSVFPEQPPSTGETPALPETPSAVPEQPPSNGETPASPETPSAAPEQPPSTGETPTSPETPSAAEEAPPEEPRVLVVEVLIDGVEGELENLVYRTIRTQPGRTATRSQLQADVNAIYATGYFGNVQVIPQDTPLGVRITFAVQPNPVLQEVTIETVPASDKAQVLPPEVVQEVFGEQYGKILNLRDLQSGIKELNDWYSKNGYDLAQVVAAPKVNEDGRVTLVIAEGILENIQVRYFDAEDEPASGRTREFIITREMRLKPGDVFNRNTAQRDLQRIFGLGIFEDAKISFSPGQDPREVVMNIDVVEGNTGSLAAGAGISSSSGLFGTLSYQERNLGGNNQTIGTEIQLGERELLFDVSFTDPWIAGDPYRTSYSLNGFRRRTISLVYDGDDSSIRTLDGFDSPRVVRTGGGVTFFRPIAEDVFSKPDWRLYAGLSYQRVQIENANGNISPLSAPLNGFDSQLLAFSSSGEDDLIILSFGASQDFRDNPLQPTSGWVTRLGVEQSVPVGSGSILLSRLRGSYSYYIPIKLINFDFSEGPQALAFNVQAGTVLGDLPPYEAFVLGGSNSVRGYAEGEVGSGRSFFQATAEYRFPIFSAIGGALFLDYGTNIGSQDAVPGIPGIIRGLPGDAFGYGIGVRIQSPVGPIRIDYGFNQNGGSRINFGIGERF